MRAISLFPAGVLALSLLGASEAHADSTPSSSGVVATSCDLKKSDRWSAAAQAAIDEKPGEHTKRCSLVAAYAASTLALADTLPAPCSDFASLNVDRQQVARYNWAYGTILEEFTSQGKTEKFDRISKALKIYNEQFAEYSGKIEEFRGICVRVHSPAGKASQQDVSAWSLSGTMMRSSVKNKIQWTRGGIKDSLDTSFASVRKALK